MTTDRINAEQYMALAEFDALLKDRYEYLKSLNVPVFASVGVLQKAIYNYQRTAEKEGDSCR